MREQLFKILSFLCIALSVVNAASAETIYKYGVPHECGDTGLCSYAIFVTSKKLLQQNETGSCLYMTFDPDKTSEILRLKGKNTLRPVTTFIVNLDTPIAYPESSIKSFIQYVEFDCTENRTRILNTNAYSNYFGLGEMLEIIPGDKKWVPSENIFHKMVRNLLCKNVN